MSNIELTPSLPLPRSHGTSFYQYLQEVNKFPSLTQDEEQSLAKSYIEHHNLAAARSLVASHLKLVVKIALGYRHYGLPVPDLVSEGNIGLMQAVKKYQPSLGFRLSTYAMWWIKAAIQEYVLKSWSLVRLGTTAAQKKLFFGLNKIKKKISALYGRGTNHGDYKEIADNLDVTVQEVSEMDYRLSHNDLSLNQPVTQEQDKQELIELVQEPRPNQEQMIAAKQELEFRKVLLAKAMHSLSAREREILSARKLSEPAATLDSLSKTYLVSKERIRQLENQAFNKLQAVIATELNKKSYKAITNS